MSENFKERINRYSTILILSLFVLLPPLLCGLFYLSQVPDISWGSQEELAFTRIWMYRERRPVGIGYQSRRIITEYGPDEVCVRTKLRFVLWGDSDKAQPATTTKRMTLVDGRWQATGEGCQPN